MSTPTRWTHLLDAEATLAEGHRHGTLVTVCGDLVSEPPECAVDGADDDPRYCTACVCSATRVNTDADPAAWPDCTTGATGEQPRAYVDHLAATVELHDAARRTLREVITLAHEVHTLTDEQLRHRLTALAKSCNR